MADTNQVGPVRRFSNFICIDWSGAVTERPRGIAAAQIGQSGPPSLLSPKPRWSRIDILNWLTRLADAQTDVLIGMDLSFGLPFADHDAFFPEWDDSPATAHGLWALVDNMCGSDAHLAVSSLLEHPQARRHFRHAKGNVGDLFEGGIGRLRVCEHHQRATRQANSWSCFNLVGAGQVGKSSLTGMRLLHRLSGQIPVWPFDPLPEKGPALIEIYTSIAARAAGMPPGRSKIRDRKALISALRTLDTPAPIQLSGYDDHSTDALMTAAWMRSASEDPVLWNPALLTGKISRTEGWTFGVI